MTSPTDAAIAARGLTKTYPKGVRALDGLSFAVPAGTLFALLGPNGAGKSTTVKILTTLTRADSGEALVAGHDVRREPDAVRRAIGVVGQKNSGGVSDTGRENLALQGRMYGLRGAELKARVDELLARFDLWDAANRVVRGYSGGMHRRLDIAMGLVHRPRVLFLDEPTTGLDPEVRAEMWEEISALRDDGVTILLTTHYLEEADRLANQVAIVDRGRIVAAGTPNELKGELRGDAVQIELAEPPRDGEVRKALADLDGVGEVVLGERSLRARADDGAAAVPVMLAALEGQGVRVASVMVSRPSLDDVYLRHTGRSFHDVDAQGGAS
ncbi:MAG TPA: ATP-binding cassette domain-containing protein [Streptosporangiaceae bacterium]